MKLSFSILGVALCVALSSCGLRARPPAESDQPSKYDSNPIVKALDKSNIPVYFDTKYCSENEVLGAYNQITNFVEVCVDRQEGREVQLRDTIRHEAVHAMQDCIDGLVYSKEQIKEWASKEELEYIMDSYRPRLYAVELEATVMARKYSDDQIAKMVYNFCINK